MTLSTFLQAAKNAWQDATRNLRLSVLTIALVFIAFIFADVLFFVSRVTSASIHALREDTQMIVYFEPNVNEEQIRAAETEIGSVAGIRQISHVSAEVARRQFEERHAGERDLIDALQLFDENPLGGRLILILKDPEVFPSVRDAIRQSTFAPLLRDTDFTNVQDVLAQVTAVTKKIEHGAAIIFSILALFVLVTAYSVVGIRIAAHRDAIRVMHMVGATERFIRLPFFLMTLAYVVVALAFNIIAITLLATWFGDAIRVFFTGIAENPVDLFLSGFAWFTFWKGACAAVLMSVSTMLALKRYSA